MSFFGLSLPTFAQPLVLFALVVPVALIGWAWAHRWLLPSRRVVLPSARVGGRSGWWYWSPSRYAPGKPVVDGAAPAMILTPGNKSETSVGYSTLYGDAAGGFAVIKDVLKTRVYRLVEYRTARDGGEGPVPRSIIERPPSAERLRWR